MDADVDDPPGQSTDQATKRGGLRALFRKADQEDSGAEYPVPDAQSVSGAKEAVAGTKQAVTGTKLARRQQYVRALAGRPVVNPRLRADPRLRVWVIRGIVTLAVYLGFTIGLGWRYGVTAAVIYAAADSVYRSKTTAVVPPAARITSAQRFSRRRLKILQPAGYLSLHARTIPGTRHVIDHIVVGPAGVFTLDSQRLDRRLPLRVIGGMLYHGRTSMEERLEHARHEAKHAASLIAAELGQRVRVRPAMVMYGPNISWVIMKVKGVDVFDGSRIGTYFRRQSKATGEHCLSTGQIAMVFAAAARALPPLN